MIVQAPGKLLVTGAYAVLEGAPAIVCAVNRFAYASTAKSAIDTRELYDGAQKLGLGSSAASMVAKLGLAAAVRGSDVASISAREAIFREACEAHQREQSGGSGVDVAASSFGGVLRYVLGSSGPEHRAARAPEGAVVDAFWSGTSARTSDLRARVDALRARDRAAYDARMRDLGDAAVAGAAAVDEGDLQAWIDAARRTLRALSALGRDADAPIVPEAFEAVARVVEESGGAFLPSGAGGGDVGVYVGSCLPPADVLCRSFELGMQPLGIKIDTEGLRVVRMAQE